VGGIGIKRDLK